MLLLHIQDMLNGLTVVIISYVCMCISSHYIRPFKYVCIFCLKNLKSKHKNKEPGDWMDLCNSCWSNMFTMMALKFLLQSVLVFFLNLSNEYSGNRTHLNSISKRKTHGHCWMPFRVLGYLLASGFQHIAHTKVYRGDCVRQKPNSSNS